MPRLLFAVLLASSIALAPAAAHGVASRPRSGVQVAASPKPSPASTSKPAPKRPPFWDVIGRVRFAISDWFASLVRAALRPVFGLLGRTVFGTPDVGTNRRVGELWRVSLGIADAVLVLLVLYGAGIVTIGSSVSSATTAKEMLPRLLAAAISAQLSLTVLHVMTDVSSALSRALLGDALASATVAGRMMLMLSLATTANPFLALCSIVVVVLAVMVLVAYIVRVAALVVLASAAPLMLCTHALPQTEGLAQTWWRAVTALLAVPVMQSMILSAAFRVMLGSDGLLGLSVGNGLIDLLVVGCLLYLLYKVTFLSLRYSFNGANPARAGRKAIRLAQVAVSA